MDQAHGFGIDRKTRHLEITAPSKTRPSPHRTQRTRQEWKENRPWTQQMNQPSLAGGDLKIQRNPS